jgi:hypothetical protein
MRRLLRITSQRPSAGEETSIAQSPFIGATRSAPADFSSVTVARQRLRRTEGWAENLTRLVRAFQRVKFSLKLGDAVELDIQIGPDGPNVDTELVDEGSQPSVGAPLFLELGA